MKLTPSETKKLSLYAIDHDFDSSSYSDIWTRYLWIARNVIDQPWRPFNRGLACCISGLEHELLGKAVYERLLHGRVSELGHIMLICSRLRLMRCIIGGPDYHGGGDCYHILDLMFSLASKDSLAVNYYLSNYEPPFTNAHRFIRSTANYLYAILQGRNDFPEKFYATTKFEQSFYSALCHIGAKNHNGTLASIKEVARNYRRTSFSQPVYNKHICFMALGLISAAHRAAEYHHLFETEIVGVDHDLFRALDGKPLNETQFDSSKCEALWASLVNPYLTSIENICLDLRKYFSIRDTYNLVH